MAASQRSLVQDQIADVTECSICSEMFTNPKILPCVHTFCLHCLETYGKDKKPGDQMVCPICRKEFLIPVGGFTNLPNNFFIGKMVEIGKLASAPTSKSLCALCPEDDEVLAELFCVDCEQNLCSRCGKGHKKSRFSQHHQIVELGGEPKAQELNLRNSYCDHHPGETIKMFCYEDKVAICLICCVESHQSHRCVNVNKAAGEFTEQLKTSMTKVADRLPECEDVVQKLDKFKKEFAKDVLETEKCIRDATTQLKKLIDQQTEILIQHLKLLREQNLKAIEITKQDVDRFKVMIESFSRYCKELLARGSPVDVCGAANHLLTRANELGILPANCSGDCFRCDSVSFCSSNIVGFLEQYGKNIAVGELTVTQPSNRLITFLKETSAVVRNLTSKRHKFGVKEENVEPCYPWLDLNSVSESSYKVLVTSTEIPTSVALTIDPKAVHFIIKHQELQNHIGDSLEKFNCSIVWPNEGKGEVKLEFRGNEVQKLSRRWVIECFKVLQKYADELTWKKQNVLQEIWSDFKTKIKEHAAKKSKVLDFAFENDQCQIQYMGLKKDTDDFETFLNKIKGELEKELERRKQRISENVSNLRPHHLALIRTEEFRKRLKKEIPDIDFEVKQSEVNLCGMPVVVRKARLFILEKLTGVAQHSFEISESMSKVFAKDDARPYLLEMLHNKGISACWTCNDRSVIVYALDENNLKEAVEVLTKEVVEVHIQLNRESELLVQTSQWKDFIGSLYTDNKFLEVAVMGPTVVAACTRNIADSVQRRLHGFIEKHAILYNVFPMDKDVVDVIKIQAPGSTDRPENRRGCRVIEWPQNTRAPQKQEPTSYTNQRSAQTHRAPENQERTTCNYTSQRWVKSSKATENQEPTFCTSQRLLQNHRASQNPESNQYASLRAMPNITSERHEFGRKDVKVEPYYPWPR